MIAFIDFYKAFDSVPRGKLIEELNRIGIDKRLVNVYADFLSKTHVMHES
jgi:hypothetical protein